MNIEEKARAYDEALERCKEWASGTWGHSVDDSPKDIAKFIFPQLAESEDERIRKHLIDIVETYWGKTNEPGKAADLAYLEKQKEQKPAEKQDYSGLNDFERAIHRGFLCAGVVNVPVNIIKETAQDCLAHLPVEWSEDFDKEVENIHKRYPEVSFAKLTRIAYHFSKWANNYKCMKWSEEDEGELQNTIDALEFLGKKGVYKSESGYDAALQAASWLKTLPEKLSLQPKQKLNEEDKVCLEDALWCVKQASKVARDENDMGACWSAERWLKNLSLDLKKRNEDVAKLYSNEWSEEDKQKLNRIYEILGYAADDNGFLTSKRIIGDKEAIELQDFLSSLRPHSQQEWSEEDELMIKCCFRAIEHYKYTGKRNVFCPSQFNVDGYLTSPEKVQTWLESLRNRVGKEFLQPHWKPTEEQMKWLKDVLETVPMTCRQQVPLESLYNDLLKLADDCINTYHRTFIQEL